MMVKKVLMLLMVIAALMSVSVSAFAEQSYPNFLQPTISPRWSEIDEVDAGITANGSTLYYSAFVLAKSQSASITGTTYLQRYAFGKWTNVENCSIRDTGSAFIEESFVGAEGVQYRTKVVVSVAGESATAYSDSITL